MRRQEAGVVAQPGARDGERVYCPVSGVVFEASSMRPRREVAGQSVYFCCPGCAEWFDLHRSRVVAARRL